ncbi:hypothetical protein TNCV_843651 [Trichonephila clavipes]|nr:hypothetical protein TNCV_843651 [Trichonephila clavipes]
MTDVSCKQLGTANLAQIQKVFWVTGQKSLKPHNLKWTSRGWSVCKIAFGSYSLIARHRVTRIKRTAVHKDCTQRDWSQVMFVDESRFSLECNTSCGLIWRESGTCELTLYSFRKDHVTD